ncbi:MAG: GNAT family N-acetyltransferase [Chloroflexi bacterium]|nr:GNAT family N-acetyltransferase [Chloroflexota bacterium]
MKVVLETRRLRLQELEPTDVENLSEILGDPVAMRYYPAPFGHEQVVSWIAWARDSYRDNGFGLWAVIRGRMAGS